jgi:tetratricopeptide (TPR) repeat protein
MTVGLIPNEDFVPELAASLIGLSEEDAARQLETLERFHLIEQYRAGRYRLHDLVREYAATHAPELLNTAERQAMRLRLIGWYHEHRNKLPAEEGANVIRVLKAWHGQPDAWRLAISLSGFRTAEFRPLELLRQAESELPFARDSGDADGLSLLYICLATLVSYVGDRGTAVDYAQEAVRIAPVDGDGHVRGNLAIHLLQAGHYAKSEPILRAARAAAMRSGDNRLIDNCTGALGNTLRILGQWDEAESLLRSLVVGRKQPSVAALLHWGRLDEDLGRVTVARAKYDRALSIANDSPDVRLRILALAYRGSLLRGAGELDLAYHDIAAALEIGDKSGRPAIGYGAREILAEILCDEGRYIESIEQLNLLPQDESAKSDRELAAQMARVRCMVYLRTGDFAQAIMFGGKACQTFEVMPYPLYRARTLTLMADAYSGLGDTSRARDCRSRAFTIFERLGVPEAETLRALMGKH